MTLTQQIETLVQDKLQPVSFHLENQSHLHHGHAGAPGKAEAGFGESHFKLSLISPIFTGLSRVERQRLVYETLAGPLKAGVHALSLQLQSPDEAR